MNLIISPHQNRVVYMNLFSIVQKEVMTVNWLQICELKSVIINRNEDIDGRVTSYH